MPLFVIRLISGCSSTQLTLTKISYTTSTISSHREKQFLLQEFLEYVGYILSLQI